MSSKELRTKIFELHTGTRPKAKDVMAAVDAYVEKCIEEERERLYKKELEQAASSIK